jgi:hypothetical protein
VFEKDEILANYHMDRYYGSGSDDIGVHDACILQRLQLVSDWRRCGPDISGGSDFIDKFFRIENERRPNNSLYSYVTRRDHGTRHVYPRCKVGHIHNHTIVVRGSDHEWVNCVLDRIVYNVGLRFPDGKQIQVFMI